MNDYQEYVAKLKTGRGGKKSLSYGVYVTRHSPTELVFTYSQRALGTIQMMTLNDQDVFTLKWNPNLSTHALCQYTRVLQLHISQELREHYSYCNVKADRSAHRNKKESIRVCSWGYRRVMHEDGSWKRNDDFSVDLPFTDGLQIKDCLVLNPEIAVDYTKRVDLAGSKAIQKKLKQLKTFCKSAAEFQSVFPTSLEAGVQRFIEARDAARAAEETLLAKNDFDSIDYEDAESVFWLGVANTRIPWADWREGYMSKSTVRAAVDAGFAELRKKLYEKQKLYFWVPVVKQAA